MLLQSELAEAQNRSYTTELRPLSLFLCPMVQRCSWFRDLQGGRVILLLVVIVCTVGAAWMRMALSLGIVGRQEEKQLLLQATM